VSVSIVNPVETIDELIDMIAIAISPHAFCDRSSDAEKAFARKAAERALVVCVPVVLMEAAASLRHAEDRHEEAIKIILGLRNLF
jgi:coenzyme F420-reducing hydrogenase beta subunit